MDPRVERALAQAKLLAQRAEQTFEKEAPKLREQLRPHVETLAAKAAKGISEALRRDGRPPR